MEGGKSQYKEDPKRQNNILLGLHAGQTLAFVVTK